MDELMAAGCCAVQVGAGVRQLRGDDAGAVSSGLQEQVHVKTSIYN
jgi:hypothetical protein